MSDFSLSLHDLWVTVVTAAGVYLAVIVLSRTFGQRQFSRLTAYDLPFIFALGALVGRVVLVRTTLLGALAGITTMFVLHAASGWLHHRFPSVHRITENRPIVLVADGRIIEDNVRRARTSVLEVHEQLRLRGFGSVSEVQAAVMERTGDVSIIRAGASIDPAMFEDVDGADRIHDPGR